MHISVTRQDRTAFAGLLILVLPIASVAQAGEQPSTVTAIDARVSRIEEFQKQNPGLRRTFSIVEVNNKLELEETPHPIATPGGDSEAFYYIQYDNTGRVLSHSEVPISYSGDWYEDYIHYFDETGNTMMYKFHYSGFGSGCTDVLRITTRYYFDQEFSLIHKNHLVADRDNEPITGCDLDPDERKESGISRNYEEVVSRIEADLIRYKKLRAEHEQWQIEAAEQRKKLLERNFVYMVGGYKRVIPFVAVLVLLFLFLFRRKIWKILSRERTR